MVQSLLQELIVGQIYIFLLVFVRVGTALMMMPTIGDSFVPANVRLIFALSLSFVMTPIMAPFIPEITSVGNGLLLLVIMEAIIGVFIGTIARFLITALDVAGMLISMQIGLGSAQVFNPGMATQGSIVGALLSMTGIVLIFATNLHHLLIYAVYDSYMAFPPGELPETGGMAHMLAMTLAKSFAIGFQMSAPFIVVALMTYIGMGVLARVMPQIQVFILALPAQITVGLLILLFSISTIFLVWLQFFEEGMMFFLDNTGGGGR